jgi:hypothetical protein
MFDQVQGKPLRGILSNVTYCPVTGKCYGILESPDFCEGEEGRNELPVGGEMFTSVILGFDVVEGQLVAITTYSCYIIEGNVKIQRGKK